MNNQKRAKPRGLRREKGQKAMMEKVLDPRDKKRRNLSQQVNQKESLTVKKRVATKAIEGSSGKHGKNAGKNRSCPA